MAANRTDRPGLVFFGTPEIAVPTLSRLYDDFRVAGVVTQPDRPAGRGRSLMMSPVKRLALDHGLTVLQPDTVNTPEFEARLREARPEVGVVAAFGQLLGPRVLQVPARGSPDQVGRTDDVAVGRVIGSNQQIVMAIATRRDRYGVRTSIDTSQITRTSKLVSHLTGIVVQPNKAIVGENAFAHEAGIHQDGVLKKPRTYEIMKPQDVGMGMKMLKEGKFSIFPKFKGSWAVRKILRRARKQEKA